MMTEIFVKIKDFDYEISNYGNIRNLKSKKLLKPYIVSKRYLGVKLCKDKKHYCFRINRLVAEYFVSFNDSDISLFVVNHKDLNKHNNYFENLEWMKQIDNVHHARNYYMSKKFNEYDQMEYEREKYYDEEKNKSSSVII
jgi:hypothetical protein